MNGMSRPAQVRSGLSGGDRTAFSRSRRARASTPPLGHARIDPAAWQGKGVRGGEGAARLYCHYCFHCFYRCPKTESSAAAPIRPGNKTNLTPVKKLLASKYVCIEIRQHHKLNNNRKILIYKHYCN